MKHECIEAKVKTEEVTTSFDVIYDKPWFPKNDENDIKRANFLILPNEYDSNELEVLFPETTSDFLSFIQRESTENEVICDIAISEENYYKIEKHSALIDIATVLVTSGLLPLAINMISSFLYDLVKRYRRSPRETSARVNIIAEDTKNNKSLKIEYEGPIDGIQDALNSSISGVFNNDK